MQISIEDKLEENIWVKGEVTEIIDEFIYCNSKFKLSYLYNNRCFLLFPERTFTKDYDFRINLKEGDIIDCYYKNKFYPATILERIETFDKDCNSKNLYLVGFRIYLDSIDKEKDLDKHKKIWKDQEIKMDENNREYIGDSEKYDEEINCLSLRIFKKDSKLFQDEDNIYDELHLYIDNNILPINDKNDKAIIIGRKMENCYMYMELLYYFETNIGFKVIIDFIYNLFSNKLINLYEFNNVIFNNNDKKEIEHKNLNKLIDLVFYALDSGIDYLYKSIMEEYVEKLMEFFINKKNMFSEEYINILDKNTYITIFKFYKKLYKLEKLFKNFNINNKDKKEKFILESQLKMLKLNNDLDTRLYLLDEINNILLFKDEKIINYINNFIKKENIPYKIINNKLVNNYENKLFKTIELEEGKNFVLFCKFLKDGRLITCAKDSIIIFNRNDFSKEITIEGITKKLFYISQIEDDVIIIGGQSEMIMIKLLDNNKYEIVQTIKTDNKFVFIKVIPAKKIMY